LLLWITRNKETKSLHFANDQAIIAESETLLVCMHIRILFKLNPQHAPLQ